ncbi:MAG: four helix bundle protein [Ignavibacteriales bacterium]|nr:four helix bundle protein [Ignavibacteriales bacterium]
MKITRFEDLDAWKEGRKLVKFIYSLTKLREFSKDYSLKEQIRRAAISVTSNIAEGFDSGSRLEFIKFLGYSRWSISEIKNQLYIASDESYISKEQFEQAYQLSSTVSKIIYGLMKYLKTTKAKSH